MVTDYSRYLRVVVETLGNPTRYVINVNCNHAKCV